MSYETFSTSRKAAFGNCQYCSYSRRVCVILKRNENWNFLVGWNLDRTRISKDEILKDNQNKNRETSCIISFVFRCVLLSELISNFFLPTYKSIKLHFDLSRIVLNILSSLLNRIHWWNEILPVQLLPVVTWVSISVVKGRVYHSDEECSQQVRSHFFCFARFFFRFVHFIMIDWNLHRIHFLGSSRVRMNFLCHHTFATCLFVYFSLFCTYRRHAIDERKRRSHVLLVWSESEEFKWIDVEKISNDKGFFV